METRLPVIVRRRRVPPSSVAGGDSGSADLAAARRVRGASGSGSGSLLRAVSRFRVVLGAGRIIGQPSSEIVQIGGVLEVKRLHVFAAGRRVELFEDRGRLVGMWFSKRALSHPKHSASSTASL